MHYLRDYRHGDPLVRLRAANSETRARNCSVEGCDRHVEISGMCGMHAYRVARHGDPHIVKKLGNGQASPERKRQNSINARKRYNQTVHGKLRTRYANAKRRVLAGLPSPHITKDDFLRLWNTTVCALCKSEVIDSDKTIDHIVPLARGGSNDISNMQIAHLFCNQSKNKFMKRAA